MKPRSLPAPIAARLRIDRIVLRAPGISASQARALAEAVAARIAAHVAEGSLPRSPTSMHRQSPTSLHLRLSAPGPGASGLADTIALRIVDAMK